MDYLKFLKTSSLAIALGLSLTSCQSKDIVDSNEDLTSFVDPFIGSGGHGHVFVGANVPFGAMQVGPSNFYKGWDWSSAYHNSDSIVKGFSHLHLSGTGCADLGDILVMPNHGELKVDVGSQEKPESGFASYYKKSSEIAKAGYYSVVLDSYDIKVELTSSERVAFHQYHFPESKDSRIIVDLGEGNSDTPTETFMHQVNDTIFAGYRLSKGWAADQREYFALIISKPCSDFSLFEGNKKLNSDAAKSVYLKGVIGFETEADEIIKMKLAISPISMENALENIKIEIPAWDFDEVYSAAKAKWNKELDKIDIQTKHNADKPTFYTALYHTMIAPNIFDDANGQYRGVDNKIYSDKNSTNYTLFSLWDTYRTAHPLYTIFQSERVPDMVNSMLKIYQQQGKLPIWHLRGNETNTMVGYSAVPVIVDAFFKGIKGIDYELAYEAIKVSTTEDFEPGIKELKKYGYIPSDKMHESVARAMEYAISDWGVSKMAEKLGKTEDAKYYNKRALAYQDYFDSETQFMRGKLSDGSWRSPFDPISAQHRVNDYCEGNAWQYIWLVPQDPEGLISLFGSDKAFTTKLDSLFSMSSDLEENASADITGLIGQYAHGNEPSHHITYLYAYAGEQYKTAEKVRFILRNLYNDKVDGLCGNEDCGQMSAWYVMSSMGFYPVNPSNGAYVFGSPLFDEAVINLANKEFKITVENNSDSNLYIQSVMLNGENYEKSFITHKDIMKGGKLKFVMGDKPNKNFGKELSNRPKSIIY